MSKRVERFIWKADDIELKPKSTTGWSRPTSVKTAGASKPEGKSK